MHPLLVRAFLRHIFLPLLILPLILAGCGPFSAPGRAPTPGAAQVLADTPIPRPSETPVPAASATPAPTTTSTVTLLPTSTPSPTPPTPTPHPMSIQALRAGTYPGSDIILEQELEPGSNYRRYYASYLSEGLKIYGLLTVPDAAALGGEPLGGWPAIVFNHGYIPPAQYRTTQRYIAYVDRLARAGYIVFRIDYRGHDRSEGVARGAYGDPGYTVDVLNALASLKRFPQANPQKIGMWGHSMGGFLTLRAMVISKDVKAGVIWGGVVGSYPDMLYHWRRTGPAFTPAPNARSWRKAWLDQYGTPDQDPAFWDSISANAYLADLSGPLQLHHAVTDEEVPVEFSQALAAQVQAAGRHVELYTYEGDNHNLSASFTLAMDRTIEFFDQYLK